MKHTFLTSIIAAGTILSATSCGLLANVNWDAEQLAAAATSAMTAVSITDDQIVALSQQAVKQYDAENTIDTGVYYQRLKKLLGKVTEIEGIPINFKVYRLNEVNAFACGDGSIRVYSGLMDIMNDGELMAIIGHEMGHVVHKDTKNAMKKAYMTAAARDVVNAAGAVGQITKTQLGDIAEAYVGSQFSQQQEFAADEYGFKFSTEQGFNPYSMATSLEKLVQLAGSSKASLVQKMFSSHPDSAERAAKMREKADTYTNKK